MSKRNTTVCGHPRSRGGKKARTVSVSLYPRHEKTLARVESALNLSRSVVVQVLLKIEGRECLLKREMWARLGIREAA